MSEQENGGVVNGASEEHAGAAGARAFIAGIEAKTPGLRDEISKGCDDALAFARALVARFEALGMDPQVALVSAGFCSLTAGSTLTGEGCSSPVNILQGVEVFARGHVRVAMNAHAKKCAADLLKPKG